MITRHLLIKGKVQGVFYRASAKEIADRLGIKGWVKNTADGDVEVVCQGDEDNIEEFVQWCKQGPSRAKVTGLEIKDINTGTFEEFSILRKSSFT